METIHTIPQLIDLIEKRGLTSAQICKILATGFKIFGDETHTPEQLTEALQEYWSKYGNKRERPLFLNLDLDVETYLESERVNTPYTAFKEYKTDKAAIVGSLHNNSLTGSKNTYYLQGQPVLKFTDTQTD